MANYVVGLDFGTHQSKICIRRLDAKPVSIHFVEFPINSNESSLLLPSVVQLNTDETVSYGYTNNDNIKPVEIIKQKIKQQEPVFNTQEPTLTLPKKPNFDDYFIFDKPPAKPKRSKYRLKAQYNSAKRDYDKELKSFCEKKRAVKIESKNQYRYWVNECAKVRHEYNIEKQKWIDDKLKFENLLNKFILDPYEIEDICKYSEYRNFKMPNFSIEYEEIYNRDYIHSSFDISVLYLTNIIFLLDQQIPEKYAIQMGVPANASKSDERSKFVGQKLLVYSFELKSKFSSWSEFLEAKMRVLIEKISSISISDKDIFELAESEYWIGIIPEAFSGLISATITNKISRGLYLSVDIGGGTTDVSLFTIDDSKTPLIHCGASLNKGLNTIYELHLGKTNNNTRITLHDIISVQEKVGINQLDDLDENAITSYRENLRESLVEVFESGVDQAIKKHQIKNKSLIKKMFYKAIEFQPIVYSGGGAFYNKIKPTLSQFSNQHKVIDKQVMGYNISLRNKSEIEVAELFPILANSFGLSNPMIDDIEKKTLCELDVWNSLKEIDIERQQRYTRFDASDDL